jgi:hypothetical protein
VYVGVNAKHTVCNSLRIFARELADYKVTIPEEREDVLLRVRLKDLASFVRYVQKKDELSLCKPQNSRDLLISIKKGVDGQTQSINHIRLLDTSGDVETEYDFEDEEDESKPNCSPLAREFTKMCTTMKSVKCDYVSVYGYEDGVIFKGYLENGSCGSTVIFGTPNNSKKKEIDPRSPGGRLANKIRSMEEQGVISSIQDKMSTSNSETSMKVEISVISSLAKINNLCDKGTAKVYVKDKILKLLCNVGMFGYLRIYITEDREEEEEEEEE